MEFPQAQAAPQVQPQVFPEFKCNAFKLGYTTFLGKCVVPGPDVGYTMGAALQGDAAMYVAYGLPVYQNRNLNAIKSGLLAAYKVDAILCKGNMPTGTRDHVHVYVVDGVAPPVASTAFEYVRSELNRLLAQAHRMNRRDGDAPVVDARPAES
jgi:predicted alpha/beta-hydrolase family hydrolase